MNRTIIWIFAGLSLVGAALNSVGYPILAQAVWIIPNTGLMIHNYTRGDLPHAVLFLALLALALAGVWRGL